MYAAPMGYLFFCAFVFGMNTAKIVQKVRRLLPRKISRKLDARALASRRKTETPALKKERLAFRRRYWGWRRQILRIQSRWLPKDAELGHVTTEAHHAVLQKDPLVSEASTIAYEWQQETNERVLKSRGKGHLPVKLSEAKRRVIEQALKRLDERVHEIGADSRYVREILKSIPHEKKSRGEHAFLQPGFRNIHKQWLRLASELTEQINVITDVSHRLRKVLKWSE